MLLFISLLNISVLIYRHAIDFCVLILYPGVLLNLLISSKRFLVESLGFLYIKLYHLQTETILVLFLSKCLFFLFFFPKCSS